MARKIHKSQLELFVESYLKRLINTNKVRPERKFLEKTIALITAVTSDSPCCTDDTFIIDLHTPKENQLTHTVRNLLFNIDRRLHKKSLQRTIDLINAKLHDPCCFIDLSIDTSSFDCALGILKLSLIGQDGQGTYTAFISNSESGAVIKIPNNVTGDFIAKVTFTFDTGSGENQLDIFGVDGSSSNIFDLTFNSSGTQSSANFDITLLDHFVLNCGTIG